MTGIEPTFSASGSRLELLGEPRSAARPSDGRPFAAQPGLRVFAVRVAGPRRQREAGVRNAALPGRRVGRAMQSTRHVNGDVAALGAHGHSGQVERVLDLRPGDVCPVRAGHDVEAPVGLVHGGEADADGETGTEHRVPPAIAVFVPRQADEPVDRIDSLEEPLRGHVGEVFAERIARPVTDAEQFADGGVPVIGDERMECR